MLRDVARAKGMAAGGPGDHPISDITNWDRPVYGADTDRLIREIARLCSRRELYEWWEQEIGWEGSSTVAAEKSRAYYEILIQRAREGGWELTAENDGK